jgi:hypothetical protein
MVVNDGKIGMWSVHESAVVASITIKNRIDMVGINIA